MSDWHTSTPENGDRNRETPSGLEGLADLVFDDDPIEDLVYGHPSPGPTPADLLRVLAEDRPLTEDTARALAGLFARNQNYLESVWKSLPSDRFAELVPLIWTAGYGKLEPEVVISLGVWLGFQCFATGDPVMRRKAWGQLADIYRQKMKAPSTTAVRLADHTLAELERAAGGLWDRQASHTPETCSSGAAAFLSWFRATGEERPVPSPQTTEDVDQLLGARAAARVLADARRSFSDGGNPAHLAKLGALTSTALATAIVAGHDHPFLADVLNRIFVLLTRRTPSPAALVFGERSLAVRESTLGYEHPLSRLSRTNLGAALTLLGELEKAEQMLGDVRDADSSDWHLCYWLARFYEARAGAGDTRSEALAWRHYLNNKLPVVPRRWQATRRLDGIESMLTDGQDPAPR